MKKTKGLIAITLAVMVAILLPIVATASSHTETKPYNWYIRKAENNQQPGDSPEFKFIHQHDGYSIDRGAKDSDKVIYLTFDLGYDNGNSASILETMKKHNATGAWFILDNVINRNFDIVQKMIDDGHLVCNHTARHPDMAKITDPEIFAEQLTALEKLYEEKTGQTLSKYYRPPSGSFTELNLRHAKDLGYKTVFWSMAYADWDNNKQPCPEESYNRIMKHTHNGMVLLLHPTSATNAKIMDRLLTSWTEQGYRFGSLEELCR